MPRAPLLLAALLGACSFQHAVGGDAGTSPPEVGGERMDWLDGFASRKPIDLAGEASQLDDFVVAIVEAADPDLVNSADLAFTAADGTTLLAAERVAFDKASGRLEAWVRTTLVAGAPTRIYLYYGGSTTATRPPVVWAPTLFAGAWHMTGAASGTTDSVRGNNAIVSGTAPGSATGIAGLARSYDGLTQALAIPDPPDGSLDFGTGSFGYSVWVDVTQSAGGYDMPLSKGGFSSLDPGYDLELGTSNWNFSLSDGTGGTSFYVTLEPESAGLGAWHQLGVVVDRATANVTGYIDGVAQPPVAFSLASFDNTHPLYLGGDTYHFAGLLDEVRVYATAPSADWLAAEHANLADAAGFVTIGAAQQR